MDPLITGSRSLWTKPESGSFKSLTDSFLNESVKALPRAWLRAAQLAKKFGFFQPTADPIQPKICQSNQIPIQCQFQLEIWLSNRQLESSFQLARVFQLDSQIPIGIGLEFGWIGKIWVGLDWQLVGKIQFFLPIVQPWRYIEDDYSKTHPESDGGTFFRLSLE